MSKPLRLASSFLGMVVMSAGLATAASSTAASASTLSARRPPAASVKPDALSSVCTYTSSQPSLIEGATGVAVEQAQCELNWAYANGHGLTVAVDGHFGPLTLTVTKDFQRCVGISTDGKIGPATWSNLNYWVDQPGYACD